MRNRVFWYSIFILILCSLSAQADSASQSSWSDGPGVPGPVAFWSDGFNTCECIDYFSDQSALSPMPSEITVGVTSQGVMSVYSNDINGDGFMDVLGGVWYGGFFWWENVDGSGGQWLIHEVDITVDYAVAVYSDDVNGDGYMDVIGTGYGEIIWWMNTDGLGTSWTKYVVDTFNNTKDVTAHDVNGDGYVDIIGASGTTGDVSWWENMDGSGTVWIEHVIDGSMGSVYGISTGDINGDDFADVLGVSYGYDVAWWENVDGSGTIWTEHLVDEDFRGGISVCAANINGDGYMDIVAAAHVDCKVAWWSNNNGAGTDWTRHTLIGEWYQPLSVYVADLSGNGCMDILACARPVDEIIWWENSDTSPGLFRDQHTIDAAFDGACSVNASDISGDGKTDVVGGAMDADQIAWWDLNDQTGHLESSILDTNDYPYWDAIDWTCTEPAGSNVAFQVRASDNYMNMGEWSDTLDVPCSLSGILNDCNRYLQYKALLHADDPLSLPTLDDIIVSWNSLSLEGGSGFESYELTGARPNPAHGRAIVAFQLPVDSVVELTVFDLSGRMVYFCCGEYNAGFHEAMLKELPSGIYTVRLSSEGFTDTHQFVMMD